MKLLTESYLSFFSSGFPSHVKAKAVDVGFKENVFYSPFSGEIVSIEKFKIGRPNKFAKTDYDVLITLNVKGKKVKILHVLPYKEEGNYVKEGEILGEFLQSPYTGGDFPHAHIEGIRINFPKTTSYDDRGIGEVINVTPNYFEVRLKTYSEAGNLRGLGCCGGLLNASLPYAGYGAIIGVKASLVEIGGVTFHVSKIRRKNVTLFEIKRGLLKNWEYDSVFKVMENKGIGGSALFETILAYKAYPLVRFFFKTDLKEGDETDVWEMINSRIKFATYDK